MTVDGDGWQVLSDLHTLQHVSLPEPTSQQAAQGTAQRTASRCVQQALPFFSMLGN